MQTFHFEPDYLAFLMQKFSEDPKLGVAGTPFIEEGYDSVKTALRERIMSRGHANSSDTNVFRRSAGIFLIGPGE